MRTLTWSEVEDVLAGATILGCGGGGEFSDGLEPLKIVYEQGLAVTLAAPDEISDSALVACPYAVGSMTSGDMSVYGEHPFTEELPGVLALRALADHVGREFDALICGELGGTSVADAFFPAAKLGIPVIDADPTGRAVPEIEHSMFSLHGLPPAPLAVVNEIGETVLIATVADDRRSESLVRAISTASRNAVWVADHPLEWGQLRDAAVPGTIGLAERVGRAQRDAASTDLVPAAVAAAGEGFVVFEGTVAAYEWGDDDAFTTGETVITGTGECDSSTYRVWFKNENLLTWRDDVPDISCPDLICLMDGSTGTPVTNPKVVIGSQVAVIAFPSAPQWRTSEGVASLGPRHFGFGIDFVPVETRHGAPR